jgi:ankyrin repeat protein
LLRKGANEDIANNYGRTPLHLEAESGHVEVIRDLLSKGGNVDSTDNKGCTPLHLATENWHIEVIR